MFKTTCRNVLQLIDAYLDGELSPGMTAEVDAHLLQCHECQRQFELMRSSGNVIAHDHSEPGLPEGFADQIIAALPQFDRMPRMADQRRPSLLEDASRPAESFASSTDSHPVRMLESHVVAAPRPWRRRLSMGLPAAAAALFLSAVFWPQAEVPLTPQGPGTLVAGKQFQADENGKVVKVAPLLSGDPEEARRLESAVENVRQAPLILQQALQMAFGEVHGEVAAGLESADGSAAGHAPQSETAAESPREWSVMDVLFPPLSELIVPGPAEAPEGEAVERF